MSAEEIQSRLSISLKLPFDTARYCKQKRKSFYKPTVKKYEISKWNQIIIHDMKKKHN